MICLLFAMAAAGPFDIDAVVAKANAEGRGVVVVVSSEYCEPCKMLEREVIEAKDADAVFRHAVVVVVDEADAGFARVKVLAPVQQFPTVLVLDKTGRERERLEGYGGHDEFAAEIGVAIDGKRDEQLSASLDAATDDVLRALLSQKLGERRLNHGDARGLFDLERAAVLDVTGEGLMGPLSLRRIALWHEEHGEESAALSHWLSLWQRYPKMFSAPEAATKAAGIFHKRGDDKTASEILRRQLKIEPRYTVRAVLDFATDTGVFVDEAGAAYDRAVKRWPDLKEMQGQRDALKAKAPPRGR